MALRDTLEALMLARGENPHSLSVKSRVPQPTIFRIMKGESKEPRRSNVDRLARALGVTTEDLYSGAATTPTVAEPARAYGAEMLELRATSTLVLDQMRGVLAPLGLALEDVLPDVGTARERIEAALSAQKKKPAAKRGASAGTAAKRKARP